MKTLLLILLLATTITATAQNDDPQFPKFGKVSEKDFQHTELDDLGYDAVVLLNEKTMYFEIYNSQLHLFNHYHIRLKALKDGFNDDDIFNVSFSGRYEYERLLSPRCWVYRQNGKKIVTEKTKYKNIKYIDRDSLDSHIQIIPPAIQKGDIIEIEYILVTFDFILPPVWRFSHKYPCHASRLTGKFPYFMEYKYDVKGLYANDIQHTQEVDHFVNLNYSYSSSDNPKSLNYMSGVPDRANFVYKFGANFDEFKMTHIMPDDMHEANEVSHLYGTAALRMRAYKFTQEIGYTDSHYYAWQQLTHLLYTYADPDNRYIPQLDAWHQTYNPGFVIVASDNWPRLFKQQRKSPQFWKPMLKAIDIPDELKSLNDPDEPLDTLAAAEKIYNYVINNITWDSTFNNHINRSIDNIIKSRRGNSAEINMALIALLRRTGVSALATMTCTREFGEVDTAYANTMQFNTVLACVPYEERLILLDATDPKKQFGKVTPQRYDRTMWFLSPFKYFFGDAEYTDDKNYQLKKITNEM
ncbi:MAG: DUF3857 domain-containing protein [Bacteroidales bacterium]|nr:DUF3857 domain-containing protein [Bacteroidales bacterium]